MREVQGLGIERNGNSQSGAPSDMSLFPTVAGQVPQIGVPGPENRDLRQLLWHRHRLVQMRADHESVAGVGDERGLSLQEKTVQREGTSTAGRTLVGSLGQSASTGVVGAAGPHESDD